MTPTRSVLVLALLLAIPSVGDAATLLVPLLYANNNTAVSCVATNFGTKPATVAITGRDEAGNEVGAVFDSCSLGATAPGAACVATFANNQDVSCSFDAPGKVRAVATLFDSSTFRLLSVTPATK